jgi:hypothetical protein
MKYSELERKLKKSGCYLVDDGGGIPFGIVRLREKNFKHLITKAKK